MVVIRVILGGKIVLISSALSIAKVIPDKGGVIVSYLIRLLFYAPIPVVAAVGRFVGAIVEMVLALAVPMYTRQVVDRLADPG